MTCRGLILIKLAMLQRNLLVLDINDDKSQYFNFKVWKRPSFFQWLEGQCYYLLAFIVGNTFIIWLIKSSSSTMCRIH